MQAQKCLELKIDGSAMDEPAFQRLAGSQQALGTSLETDFDSGAETHVAWFALTGDEQLQRAQLSAAALLSGAMSSQVQLKVLGDDWETAWQKNWHAMSVGKHLCVRPSFCKPLEGDYIDIVLDPGMAFGTGQHATTRLCLEAIERVCDEAVPASMLDMGAGSGLLAIAAGKLGAKGIVAVDNDPISVEASRVNAKINGVELESVLSDTPPERTFDLVVANILAGPLIEMAPKLAKCVGRHLVLSGLLCEQVEPVSQAYADAGMQVLRSDSQQEWASVELTPLKR
ncbi:MAG: 50S ribosomal protein L11 methyltransferase [Mariprofundaceae bacterium]|nr:50S ribosomal protein L11 methyltransferase [Mariprofundaceae bacterium]